MHDEAGMRMCYCLQYVKKQTYARFDPKLLLVAIVVDASAFNVLKHEIGLSGSGDPGIEQLRDVGMCQPREKVALPFESLFSAPAHESNVEELHCHAPFKSAVVPLCQPHAPHSAVTDLRQQGVCAQLLPVQPGFFWEIG